MNTFDTYVNKILLKESPLNVTVGNEMRGTISGKSTDTTTPIKQPLEDKSGYPSYENIRTAITVISIVDPTPVTSIPDILEDGYKFISNPNTETAITFLLTLLFALPYLDIVKGIKALGKTKQAEKQFVTQILNNKQDIINKAKNLNSKLGEMTQKSFNYI